MLRKYCHDTGKEWDEGVHFVLSTVRDAKQESLGFSPAEFVCGHNVSGPWKELKKQFVSSSPPPKINVSDFGSRCRERLQCASMLAKEALSSSQDNIKRRFNAKAVERQFKPGEKVLVLLPVPGSALTARFSGPYVVESKASETDYVIHTPERRRKKRLCHINMLKPFHSREVAQGKQRDRCNRAHL